MDYGLREWASHSGWKVVSGLLMGIGILVWTLAKYVDGERLSNVGVVTGECFVAAGLMIAVVAFVITFLSD